MDNGMYILGCRQANSISLQAPQSANVDICMLTCRIRFGAITLSPSFFFCLSLFLLLFFIGNFFFFYKWILIISCFYITKIMFKSKQNWIFSLFSLHGRLFEMRRTAINIYIDPFYLFP